MKSLFSALLIGALFALPTVAAENCEITENHGFHRLFSGKLSPFWGYEATGIDLVKEDFASQETNQIPFGTWESVHLSEFPSSFLSNGLRAQSLTQEKLQLDHGTKVAKIIGGATPFAVSLNSKLVACSTDSGEHLYNNTDEFLGVVGQTGMRLFEASTNSADANFFAGLKK